MISFWTRHLISKVTISQIGTLYLSAHLLQIEHITIGMAVISLLTQVQITLKDVMV